MDVSLAALEPLGRRIERSSNRIAPALVAVGSLVVASALMQHEVGPATASGVPWLALAGFAAAALAGLALLWNMRRGPRA